MMFRVVSFTENKFVEILTMRMLLSSRNCHYHLISPKTHRLLIQNYFNVIDVATAVVIVSLSEGHLAKTNLTFLK